MELYIHIPFCIRKCAYCDFLSGPAEGERQDAYMEALLREVRLAGEMHHRCSVGAGGTPSSVMGAHEQKEAQETVDTIFIGGGTPSAVEAGWIVRLMEQIRASFLLAEDAEITMEANPGTLTAEKLAQYRQAGINRLSMGLQSTEDEELRRLGRIHTYQEFLENFRLAREAGFTNINIDLMSALPGQTVESYEQTLRRVVALELEHISAYSLIIEEGTPFWDLYGDGAEDAGENVDDMEQVPKTVSKHTLAQYPLPTEEEDRRMYHLTKEILAQAGYERYEISNYAKPGCECRHNVGYWTRVPYLGLGLGASSYYGGQRFSNTREMQEYLAVLGEETVAAAGDYLENVAVVSDVAGAMGPVGSVLRQEIQTLTPQDAMEEFMFLGLRLTRGVCGAEFVQMFGQTIESVYGPVLEKLTGQGLLEKLTNEQSGDTFWRLTEWGLDVSNHVLAEFLF